MKKKSSEEAKIIEGFQINGEKLSTFNQVGVPNACLIRIFIVYI